LHQFFSSYKGQNPALSLTEVVTLCLLWVRSELYQAQKGEVGAHLLGRWGAPGEPNWLNEILKPIFHLVKMKRSSPDSAREKGMLCALALDHLQYSVG